MPTEYWIKKDMDGTHLRSFKPVGAEVWLHAVEQNQISLIKPETVVGLRTKDTMVERLKQEGFASAMWVRPLIGKAYLTEI